MMKLDAIWRANLFPEKFLRKITYKTVWHWRISKEKAKLINMIAETAKFFKSTDILTYSLSSVSRSADAELQQRASEYLALSKIPSLDVLATVLEEMPPFPEKESSGLLNLLKKRGPAGFQTTPKYRREAVEASPGTPAKTQPKFKSTLAVEGEGTPTPRPTSWVWAWEDRIRDQHRQPTATEHRSQLTTYPSKNYNYICAIIVGLQNIFITLCTVFCSTHEQLSVTFVVSPSMSIDLFNSY